MDASPKEGLQKKEVALMRRLMMVSAVTLVVAAMMMATAVPVFAQSFVAAEGQDSVELVLSGGPSPTDPLWADDDLSVYLNGNPILVDDNDLADGDLGTVSFTAKNGDQLRIVARDEFTGCRSRSPLYLHSTSDGTSYQLAEEINDCSGESEPPAPTDFYDETFTITVESGDTTPPEVSWTSPSNYATGVDATANINVGFFEEGSGIDSDTLTTDTFKVVQVRPTGMLPVSGAFSLDEESQTATFDPSSSLAKGLYRVTITTGVEDKAGNALANDYTWTFATAGPSPRR